MKISIVIPVYNVKDFLPECAASVAKLRGDFQFVLVDDGSTDGSGALCDALAAKDPRFLVVHQENGGLSEARNTGIRHSTGDYICFLDSDDFLDAEQTQRMLDSLTPETDILLGRFKNYYPDTDTYGEEDCGGVAELRGDVSIDTFLDTVPTHGRAYYMIACRFVIRREFLLEHELFFVSGIYHEDEEWTQRVLCAADRVCVTDCSFYLYRQGRAGAITSGVKPKHLYDCLLIIGRASSLRKKQPEGSAKARYLSHRMGNLYLNVLLNMAALEGEARQQTFEKLEQLRPGCAPYMTGSIGTAAGLCQKLFGTKAACALLRAAKRLVK